MSGSGATREQVTALPELGSFWKARRSGNRYRVVMHGSYVTSEGLAPGGGVALEPYEHAAPSMFLPLAVLHRLLIEIQDPRGYWPFTPTRWHVEQLQGQHGVRGIVGHDTMRDFGWRSIDERTVELGLPPWKYVMWSAGKRVRTLWKDEFGSDPPMFNTPKTRGDTTGNHQKAMYPDGLFWLLDEVIRDRDALVRASVEDSDWMSDDEIEVAWDARDKSDGPNEEDRAKFAEQRKADRIRIRTWIAEAGADDLL